MKTKASLQNTVSERERKNRKLAFKAAAEGIVLLENDGVLPISPCRTALYGAGASYTFHGGSGSGEVNVRHAVNVLEGLEKAGFTIATKDWICSYDKQWKAGKEAFIKERRKKLLGFRKKVIAEIMAEDYRYPAGKIIPEEAKKVDTDTCIYVLSRQAGEGHDRKDEPGSFRLMGTEIRNIRICASMFKRFILVLNMGSIMDLSPLEEIRGINALVYMNQLGMEGGNALAAVLTGRCTPSGKLAVTWAKQYRDYPYSDEFSVYAKDATHALYKEGIYVGYRYFDSFSVAPRYPFGYGKSYTEFTTGTESVSIQGTAVQLAVKVTNTGSCAGKEVVQVYASCPQEGEDKEYQRLAAFAKTRELAPGEEEILSLDFPLSALSSYSEKRAETCLEAGDYILRVGTSSRETEPAAKLTLQEPVVLSRHRNLCISDTPIAELKNSGAPAETLPDTIPVIPIDPALFEAKTITYEPAEESISERTKKYVDRFSADDMLLFCAGTGMFGENKGFRVPGAAGHTTTAFLDQGIPNRELCDGPAGLRIQRRSTISKSGKIKAVDTAISLYEYLPKPLTRLLLGDPKKEQVLYQFVTGFPVAAAIAQSWNTALAEEVGRAVSEEMTEYGVTWWLAPALNIVRNPLCGRNFEYYSEDPLLSGKLAAAVTRGVQQSPGRFAVIKHFAANNQEENRFYVSSDLDERALREIYLKGFEIVVHEASPRAVMSAYNRINGIYCASNKELCTDILRLEWGFDGIAMTDWFAAGEDRANEAECLKAGVDLIMPGGKKTVKALQKAYKEGLLSDGEIRRSGSRVLEEILEEKYSILIWEITDRNKKIIYLNSQKWRKNG